MNKITIDQGQLDGDVLSYDVSDEALEATAYNDSPAVATAANCTDLTTCPALPSA